MKEIFEGKSRLTRSQKDSNDKQWFKEKLKELDTNSFDNFRSVSTGNSGEISDFQRMKVNYDLYNNIVNKSDFEHVCSPFGKGVGELPLDFTNKDIISGKIKALEGMETKRPFAYKAVAINEEATTRKEQESFGRVKDFVVNSIISPIRKDIETKYMQEQGQEITPDMQKEIGAKIEEELKTMTPEEVKKYMAREHQDPAEALIHQLLQYLIVKQDVKSRFNKGWKHFCIAGKAAFWVGSLNNTPVVRVVNPLRFNYDKSEHIDFFQDGDSASSEMYMTPSEISTYFGSELTNKELDEIWETHRKGEAFWNENMDFSIDSTFVSRGIRVLHGEWKALKPFKFVRGFDVETGEEYEDIVDESYKINHEVGDISVETLWIPTKYEGYLIGTDKYAFLREVPGQYKNLDNLFECKLSYIGAVCDDLNSMPTSLVDRMKYYQYMFNIIWYKTELLIASDEGKSILLNANLIPKSSGLDIEKWMYYFKVNKIGLLNPNEEGNKGSSNIGEAAKEINMSVATDIQKNMQILEYLEQRCGASVGITKQIEGQIDSNESVRNVQQSIIQSANILEPYFDLYNTVKRDVLQALVLCAKAVYSEVQPKFLSYMLDDMSIQMLKMDYDLLMEVEPVIYVSNSSKSVETLQTVQQLTHAALQNQKVELSDVIKIMRSESIQEAEEMLKASEADRIEREQFMQQSQLQAQQKSEESAREFKREEWAFEMSKMEREEELKTDRELQKQAMLSMGFNEDKDMDKDGVPDILEVYKAGVDAQIKQRKQQLDEGKFEHQKVQDVEKNKLEREKIKVAKAKSEISKRKIST
jgi:hypothetical protein